MVVEKLDAAHRLAEAHARIDSDVKRILLLESSNEDDPSEPIKLLEVVEGAMEAGIEPVGFAPNPGRGVRYPSVIVEVSPREFETIGKEIALPDGRVWTVTRDLLPQPIGA